MGACTSVQMDSVEAVRLRPDQEQHCKLSTLATTSKQPQSVVVQATSMVRPEAVASHWVSTTREHRRATCTSIAVSGLTPCSMHSMHSIALPNLVCLSEERMEREEREEWVNFKEEELTTWSAIVATPLASSIIITTAVTACGAMTTPMMQPITVQSQPIPLSRAHIPVPVVVCFNNLTSEYSLEMSDVEDDEDDEETEHVFNNSVHQQEEAEREVKVVAHQKSDQKSDVESAFSDFPEYAIKFEQFRQQIRLESAAGFSRSIYRCSHNNNDEQFNRTFNQTNPEPNSSPMILSWMRQGCPN